MTIESVNRRVSTYFIADIAANHDGELSRAVDLIHMAAAAGASAAKFQNFHAATLVSDRGFRSLGKQSSHQAAWKKSVFEVYQDASIPFDWTPTLRTACDEAGIDFFSTPYDMDAVEMLDQYVSMYKIGSGNITWSEMLLAVAARGKPVLLATGASELGEVQRAADLILSVNPQLVLMQCNTNYTGSLDNFTHIHLNVLRTYAAMYPTIQLGLSDHTPGHATVLGAVALGARFVEKHFTDDTSRTGSDHGFSMTPASWRDMVERTRELEAALGGGRKIIEPNEVETVVVQRRCLRAAKDLQVGMAVSREMLDVLRPAPADAIKPHDLPLVLGRRLNRPVEFGCHLVWDMFEPKA